MIRALFGALLSVFTAWSAVGATVAVSTQDDLDSAVTAASRGDTIQLAAGTYELPSLPNNITVKGAVDGVVFNCVGTGSIASVPNGATFQNVVFNMGTADYHGFYGARTIDMVGCTVNGKFFSYGDMNFTGCTFNQTASDYAMWAYSGNLSYINCTFTCHGKFINVYNEGNGTWSIVVKGCKFNSDYANKAALNIKENCCNGAQLHFDVQIEDCSVNNPANFPAVSGDDTTTLYVGSPLWQVDDRTAETIQKSKDGTGVKVLVDDSVAYGPVPTPVAKIVDTDYPTIEDAFKAVNDLTTESVKIKIIAASQETLSADYTFNKPVTITADSAITVSLGGGFSTKQWGPAAGNTLTIDTNVTIDHANMVGIKNGGKVIVKGTIIPYAAYASGADLEVQQGGKILNDPATGSQTSLLRLGKSGGIVSVTGNLQDLTNLNANDYQIKDLQVSAADEGTKTLNLKDAAVRVNSIYNTSDPVNLIVSLDRSVLEVGSCENGGSTANAPRTEIKNLQMSSDSRIVWENTESYTELELVLKGESTIHAGSFISHKCGFFKNTGTLTVDMEGTIADSVPVVESTIQPLTMDNLGTLKVINGAYELQIVGNTLVAKKIPNFYQADDGVYHIRNAAGLVEFANEVNSGRNNFDSKTVMLDAAVNMSGVAFTPIGNVNGYPSTTFCGVFDGQNHVISNLTASDTTPDNASAGLFGSICGTVKDVKLTNVTITSTHFAGAIVGYSSANASVIENCHVDGGTVTSSPELINGSYDNGDKVGGIVGYIVGGDKVTNCTVKNLTVKGYRDVGGLVGMANNGSATVTGNTVANTVVLCDQSHNYKNYTSSTAYDVNQIIGDQSSDAIVMVDGKPSNTATLVSVAPVQEDLVPSTSGTWHIKDLAGLKLFRDLVNANPTAYAGMTFILDADIDLNKEEWTPIKASKLTFDGNGKTISNLKITSDQKNVGLFGEASICTIKYLTIDGANVTGINHVAALAGDGECAKIENCTVKYAVVTAKVKDDDDGDKAGAIVGYLVAEQVAWVKDCTVENCTVTGYRDIGGAIGMANKDTDGMPVVKNVTVKDTTVCNDRSVNYKNYTTDAQFDIGLVVGETVDGVTLDTETFDATDDVVIKVFEAAIGTKGYLTLQYAVAAATSGQTITLLTDIIIDNSVANEAAAVGEGAVNLPSGVTLDGAGHTITAANYEGTANLHVLNVAGATDVKIKNVTINGAGIVKAGVNCYNATVALENVKIDGCKVSVQSNNGSTVAISGAQTDLKTGTWYQAVIAENNSSVSISGGSVGYVWTSGESASATISGGTVTAAISVAGPITITGGNIGAATAYTDAETGTTYPAAFAVSGGTFSQAVPEAYCANGYIPTATTTGGVTTYGVKQGSYVARNMTTGVGHETISAAIAAVPTDGTETTIKVLVQTLDSNIIVSGGKNVKVDLNGATLNGYCDIENGKLSIDNGTVCNVLRVVGSATDVANYSVLDIGADLVVDAYYGVYVYNGGNGAAYGAVVNVNGSIECGGIFVDGNINKTDGHAAVININDGAYVADDWEDECPGICLNGYAIVNVMDGALVEGSEAVAMKAGVLNVYGGTLKAYGDKYDPVEAENSGSELSGAAISVTSTYNGNSPMSVNITGGVIESANNAALYLGHSFSGETPISFQKGLAVEVFGGTFKGGTGEVAVYCDEALETDCEAYPAGFISGGTFSTPVPEAYCATGYIPTTTTVAGVMTYTVKQGSYVAQIGTTKYETVAAALIAAQSGDTIKLLENVALTEQLVIEKAVTIDLNEKAVTSSYVGGGETGEARFAIVTKANVTLTGGSFTTTAEDATRAIGQYAGNLTLTDMAVTCYGLAVCDYAANSTLTVTESEIAGDYAIGSFADHVTLSLEGDDLTGATCGLYHNGSYHGFVATVKDCTITGGSTTATDSTGVYISGSAECVAANENVNQQISFENCSITGATGVEGKYTDMTFKNCTVTSTVSTPSYEKNNNGSTASGFAIVSTDNSMNEESPAPSATITIESGSYTGAVGLGTFVDTETEANYAISGGTFSQAVPAAYCASGYVPKNNGNGTYGVTSAYWTDHAAAEFASENATAKTITIATADQLALLAKRSIAGESFAGYTITLTENVDLAAYQWRGMKGFAGTFDGGSKTISNLKLYAPAAEKCAGLFASATGAATIKNFTITNVEADLPDVRNVAAVVGDSIADILNVKVNGTIKLVTLKHSGVIAGYDYGTVVNCSVDGGDKATSFISVEGSDVGGLVGFMGEGTPTIVSGCSVKNLTVIDKADDEQEAFAGAVAGTMHTGTRMYNTSASSVDVKVSSSDAAGQVGTIVGRDVSSTSDNGTTWVLTCKPTSVAVKTIEDDTAISVGLVGATPASSSNYLVASSDATYTLVEGEPVLTKGTYTIYRKDDVTAEKFMTFLAEGCVARENADGTYSVFAPVAVIDETQYESLAAAVAAATAGQTVKMIANEDVPETVVVSKSITIDLNGKKLFNTADLWVGDNWSMIEVAGEGVHVTLTGNGTIDAKKDDEYALDVFGGAKLTIESGSFIGNLSAVYVHSGEVVINGGTFDIKQKADQPNPYVYEINCLDANYKNGTAKVSILGGSFVGFDPKNNAAEGASTNFCAPGYKSDVVSTEGGVTTYGVVVDTSVFVLPKSNASNGLADIAFKLSTLPSDYRNKSTEELLTLLTTKINEVPAWQYLVLGVNPDASNPLHARFGKAKDSTATEPMTTVSFAMLATPVEYSGVKVQSTLLKGAMGATPATEVETKVGLPTFTIDMPTEATLYTIKVKIVAQ